jgi:hypothetical protein
VRQADHLKNGGNLFGEAGAKARFHKQRRIGLVTGFIQVRSQP